MAVAPSKLLILASELLGNAQARLRALAMASVDLNTIDDLISKREAIDSQQRRIMRANLAVVDKDPAVQESLLKLTQLTSELAAGVQEMRDATSAIKKATTIVSAADEILTLFKLA